MALTPEEQRELAQLESEFGGGLNPSEAEELAQLEREFSPQPKPKAFAKTLQEQHPNVTTGMRATVKNFANSPESGMKYLKQELPGHEVDFYDGQYRVKRADDQDWRVVDPDTGLFSTDILNDALDVAYDVPAGAVEGLAAVGGGALGTAIAPGVGTVGGAAVAGGATSAGLEAMRQKLGSVLGIPQEVDGTDVAISGGVGAVSPLLLGAGKAKGLVQKGYEFGRDTVMPKAASIVSGASEDAVGYLKDNFKKITDMEKDSGLSYTRQVHQKLQDWLEGSKDSAGKRIGEIYKGTESPVNVQNVKDILQQTKEEILASSPDNAATLSEVAGLEELQSLVATLPDQIPAEQAFNLKQQINAYAKPQELSKGLTDSQPVTRKFDAKRLVGAGRRAAGELDQSLQTAAGPQLKAANEEYAKISALEGYLSGKFRDPDMTYKTLTSLDGKSRKMLGANLNEIAEQGGIDLADDALALKTLDQFAKPGLTPISSGGTTSTSRTVPLALAGMSLGSLAGYNAGGGYAGATVGGAGGAILGGFLGSPQMVRRGIQAMLSVEKAAKLTDEGAKKLATQLGVPHAQVLAEAAKLGLATEGGKSIYEKMSAPEYLRSNP